MNNSNLLSQKLFTYNKILLSFNAELLDYQSLPWFTNEEKLILDKIITEQNNKAKWKAILDDIFNTLDEVKNVQNDNTLINKRFAWMLKAILTNADAKKSVFADLGLEEEYKQITYTILHFCD